jgi:outer membrane protein, heavy metal efflux system
MNEGGEERSGGRRVKKSGNFSYAAMSAALLLSCCVAVPPLWAQGASAGKSRITLDQAIELALKNNPGLKAGRTIMDQSRAQEVTAGLRPNPTLSWDSQFMPVFHPSLFSTETLNELQQFDMGIGYLIERGKKRQRRLDAARDQTRVTQAQVFDAERTLTFNVAQQFINVLLAKSNLDFATQDLASFRHTVSINEERYKAGDISQGDLLKTKIQLLQFETDVTSARLAKVQALASLRQLIGYDSVPRDYDVIGDLEYAPITVRLDDLEATALRERPDLRAANLGINAARSQLALARANGKQDLNAAFDYSHVSGFSSGTTSFTIPLAFFNRNQGEIARTRFALNQSEFNAKASQETVLTDVKNAYEAVKTDQEVVDLYRSGYLKQAQESRDISEFAYQQGAAALLDFLDAERSYRSTQLAYRQALAAYTLALEQLRQAVAVREIP